MNAVSPTGQHLPARQWTTNYNRQPQLELVATQGKERKLTQQECNKRLATINRGVSQAEQDLKLTGRRDGLVARAAGNDRLRSAITGDTAADRQQRASLTASINRDNAEARGLTAKINRASVLIETARNNREDLFTQHEECIPQAPTFIINELPTTNPFNSQLGYNQLFAKAPASPSPTPSPEPSPDPCTIPGAGLGCDDYIRPEFGVIKGLFNGINFTDQAIGLGLVTA
ncbi:MAG: hypothetical protein SFU25_06430 [Candidatus Caenarcaniphilales bacterium]|nr:hypothetical protein [Candidatus Caenarcaniphilales bacterium]